MANDDFKNYRKGFIISLLQLGQWWIILNGQEVLPNDLVWCGQTLQIHTELFIENNLPTFLHKSHRLILFHPQKMTKWTIILKKSWLKTNCATEMFKFQTLETDSVYINDLNRLTSLWSGVEVDSYHFPTASPSTKAS